MGAIRPNPNRSARCGVRRARGMSTKGKGKSPAAACSGDQPTTNCRYCIRMKNSPKAEKNWIISETEPALNPRSRKSRGSSMGDSLRSSRPTNRASAATPNASVPQTEGSVHPLTGPSMMPNTIPETPTRDSSALTGSRAGGCSSVEVGTTSSAPTSAIAARVTLSAKNEFQLNHSRSRPAAKSPITAPPPATPTQMPTALPRSSGGNEVVMTDRVVGITKAAPTPMAARRAMSHPGSVTKNAAAAAAPKMTSPIIRVPRRPNRSPNAPVNRSSPAKTTV